MPDRPEIPDSPWFEYMYEGDQCFVSKDDEDGNRLVVSLDNPDDPNYEPTVLLCAAICRQQERQADYLLCRADSLQEDIKQAKLKAVAARNAAAWERIADALAQKGK